MSTETTVTKYFVISFRGQPRQHALYTRLRDYVIDAIKWHRREGRHADATLLSHWMQGTGGFVRAHMPYYVTLSTDEWKALSSGLREGEHQSNARYRWALEHGEWKA